MDTSRSARSELASMAAVIERLAAGLALAEEPAGFGAALEEGARSDPAPAPEPPA
jgi:hypothetical protein